MGDTYLQAAGTRPALWGLRNRERAQIADQRVETRQKGVSSVKEGGSLRCRAVRRGMEDPGAGKNARGQEASDDIATPEAP